MTVNANKQRGKPLLFLPYRSAHGPEKLYRHLKGELQIVCKSKLYYWIERNYNQA